MQSTNPTGVCQYTIPTGVYQSSASNRVFFAPLPKQFFFLNVIEAYQTFEHDNLWVFYMQPKFIRQRQLINKERRESFSKILTISRLTITAKITELNL